jgi:hypothetical protein
MSCASFVLMFFFGYMATPDVVLLFSLSMYLFALYRFLVRPSHGHAFVLGLCAALAIYSKYHAILIVVGTVLVLWRQFRYANIYVAVATCLICVSPLIWWQQQSGFPSLRLHLLERNSGLKLENVLSYILTVGIIYLPLCVVLYSRLKVWFGLSLFDRSLLGAIVMVLCIFAVKSFSLNIFAHWLICLAPAGIVLFAEYLQSSITAAKSTGIQRIKHTIAALCIIAALARLFIAIPQTIISHDFCNRRAQLKWIQKQSVDKHILVLNDVHTAVQFAWLAGYPTITFVSRHWSLQTHLEQWYSPRLSIDDKKTFVVSASTHFKNCDSCIVGGAKFYFASLSKEDIDSIY